MGVLSVGDVLVDIIYYLPRFPKLRDDVQVDRFYYSHGGSAANLAVGLSRLGVDVYFLGNVGNDDFGKLLVDELNKEGVDTRFVQFLSVSSGVNISLVYGDEKTMVAYRGASEKPPNINRVIDSEIDFKLIFVSGYSFLEKNSKNMVIKLLKNRRTFKMIDIGVSLASKGRVSLYDLRGYFRIVSMNEVEARYLMKSITPVSIDNFVKWFGCDILIIKREDKPTLLYNHKNGVKEIPVTSSNKIVDPTGAGDAFNAGFIYGYLKGFPLEKAVEIGNKTAYYKIHGYGARHLPTLNELRNLFNLEI